MFAEGITTEQGKQPYKYNGKELDRSHGLMIIMPVYDSGYGRFTTVDPMSENYYSISPYVYVANNSMRFVDPHGRVIYPINGTWSNPKIHLSMDYLKTQFESLSLHCKNRIR